MRTITLEEHYASPGFMDGPGREIKEQGKIPNSPIATVLERLSDLDNKLRIKVAFSLVRFGACPDFFIGSQTKEMNGCTGQVIRGNLRVKHNCFFGKG